MRVSRIMLATSCAALLMAAPAAAQILYLGDQEVDTSESAAMSSAVARCAELAQAAPGAETAAAFTRRAPALMTGTPPGETLDARATNGGTAGIDSGEAETGGFESRDGQEGDGAEVAQPPAPIPLEALSLAPDQASDARGVDSGAAAGEGSGQGPEQGSNSDEESSGSANVLDLDAVTLLACKEAGLVF